MVWTPEERKAYHKAYRIKNRERDAEELYYYRINNALKFKKRNIINGWKHRPKSGGFGLICDDYDMLYVEYLKSTNCEECGCKYSNYGDGVGRFKCMDHNHVTGLFRNFLCCKCNFLRL